MEINSTNNYVELKNLQSILIEEGYTIFGHGTGGKNIEAVNSIFEKGLRTSHTSLFYTTIGLDVDKELNNFKKKLDNWEHLDSENIILIKLPNKYFNMFGDSMDLNCERTRAFVDKMYDAKGKKTYYLNPKFIIGSYNRNTSMVTINPRFERHYSKETINEMNKKLKEAMEEIKQKNLAFERELDSMSAINQEINTPENVEIYSSDKVQQFDMNTTFDDFEEFEWDNDFSSLEENNSIKR